MRVRVSERERKRESGRERGGGGRREGEEEGRGRESIEEGGRKIERGHISVHIATNFNEVMTVRVRRIMKADILWCTSPSSSNSIWPHKYKGDMGLSAEETTQ